MRTNLLYKRACILLLGVIFALGMNSCQSTKTITSLTSCVQFNNSWKRDIKVKPKKANKTSKDQLMSRDLRQDKKMDKDFSFNSLIYGEKIGAIFKIDEALTASIQAPTPTSSSSNNDSEVFSKTSNHHKILRETNDSFPYYPQRGEDEKDGKGISILAFVFGVLAYLLTAVGLAPIGIAFAIAAVVLGALGLKKKLRGLAIAGFVLGLTYVIILLLALLVLLLFVLALA